MPRLLLSTRTMSPHDWQLIEHFTPQEFRYPERMGYEFMLKLDRLRREAGVPIRITSDYRTRDHNKAVGGAKDSAHCDDVCQAVDVMPANSADAFQIMRAAFLVGFTRIGIYANGSFHFDTAGGPLFGASGAGRPDHVLWHVVSNPA